MLLDPFSWIMGSLFFLSALLGFLILQINFLGFNNGDLSFFLDLTWWVGIAQIVTAFSIAYAAATYYYQKTRDKKKDTIDLVSFYREEIAPGYLKFEKVLGVAPPRLEIEEFRYEWFYVHGNTAFERHHELFKAASKKDDQALKESCVELCNALEVLALRVFFTDSVRDEKLSAIRRAFVEVVEFAIYPLLVTNMISRDAYTTIGKLYMEWKQYGGDRRPENQIINDRVGELVDSLKGDDLERVRELVERRAGKNV